ncbi:MAG: F0F1 ATP synthase subunit B [Zetaproteobacteria bacterium]|nr:MAG: F0F1 ATP synthase subunit B [Zetaproteobacteria bacterium]
MSIDLTFVAQIIVFVTMVAVLWKLLYGPLNDLMEARAKKIAEGLAAAEAGLEARAEAEAEIARLLDDARAKAHEIIAAAEHRANEINEEAVTKARQEAEGILDAAREEVRAEVNRARQELRKEVAAVALLAAEKVIESELDAARHGKLIDSIVEKGFGAA